jgi:SAM-dependent methyltransferase
VLLEKKVVGGGPRDHDLCPRCNASDRERLVYLYLVNKTKIFDDKVRLLHVAPEEKLGKVLSDKGNIDYLSADLNMAGVMVRMDISHIAYKDAAFGVIICNHVLEHIPDDQQAMSELYRVLTPGGWAILQVPISLMLSRTYEDSAIVTPEERERAFGQGDHVRLYARDYKARLEQVGFWVEEFKWTESPREFGGPENRFGLLRDETVYIARKPQD